MIAEYIYEKAEADYSNRVLLMDLDDLESLTHYSTYFSLKGFSIIHYQNDLQLRSEHDNAFYDDNGKYLLIVSKESYIPYDIIRRYRCTNITLSAIFPKLNTSVIKAHSEINYDLLALAYKELFVDISDCQQTESFIRTAVYGVANVQALINIKNAELHSLAQSAVTYKDWCEVANLKAAIDSMAAEYELDIETDNIHEKFVSFILENYGKLKGKPDTDSPVLVSQAMDFMYENSDNHKFVIIVMDGMSEFDWTILSRSFNGIHYIKSDAYAMIPTTTSVSRQCLLSNKLPLMLKNPWSQSKEKNEFIECAERLGFSSEQISYERGYDADFGPFIKCGAVIINDVDDIVHAQKYSRTGMYRDISALTKQGQLAKLVKRLLSNGFDVFITADHGNTPCIGMGQLKKLGVETETKSHRMLVLKDFADSQFYKEQYSLIEFNKNNYLSKDYCYLLCGAGASFDARGEHVMNHGGITIDEVIVPFITIKAVDNNG